MNTSENSAKNEETTAEGCLILLFLGLGILLPILKLTGVIAWSWWWVTSPWTGGLLALLASGFYNQKGSQKSSTLTGMINLSFLVLLALLPILKLTGAIETSWLWVLLSPWLFLISAYLLHTVTLAQKFSQMTPEQATRVMQNAKKSNMDEVDEVIDELL